MTSPPRALFLFFALTLAATPACDSAGDGGAEPGGGGTANTGSGDTGSDDTGSSGPSAALIDDCKEACDHQKFFDCDDAAEQAACYLDCGEATSSAIDLFVSCVQSAACDADCSLYVEPAGGGGGGGGGGDAGGGGGDAGGGSDTPPPTIQEQCKASCDDMKFFGCLGAADQTACRNLCDTVAESTAGDFVACDQGGCDTDCYLILDPSYVVKATDFEVTVCEGDCDTLEFFGCLTAAEHQNCRSLCSSKAQSAVTTFSGCASGGDCEAVACYDTFAGQ